MLSPLPVSSPYLLPLFPSDCLLPSNATRLIPEAAARLTCTPAAVDPVKEITDLITAQRGYELNAKVITAADQMLGATTQIR